MDKDKACLQAVLQHSDWQKVNILLINMLTEEGVKRHKFTTEESQALTSVLQLVGFAIVSAANIP